MLLTWLPDCDASASMCTNATDLVQCFGVVDASVCAGGNDLAQSFGEVNSTMCASANELAQRFGWCAVDPNAALQDVEQFQDQVSIAMLVTK